MSSHVFELKRDLPFREIRIRAFPDEVQIQTHTACNARCIMCPYPSASGVVDHGTMSVEAFRRLVDECADHEVRNLKPFLMNEPLLDRRLPDLIRYARERLPRTRIGFSTNAVPLKGRLAEELAESGLDELWVNFAGATKGTYESVMKGLRHEEVLQNVLRFLGLVSARDASIRVVVTMVEIAQVVPEIPAAVAFWNAHGVEVCTTPLNNRGGNVEDGALRALGRPRARRVCDRPFYKIYIRHNGDVILCSSDWKCSTILGNALRDGIGGVWDSDRQRSIRETMQRGEWDELPLCHECDYATLSAPRP